MSNWIIAHSGIKGMHWGVRNGPPYPIRSGIAGARSVMNEVGKISYKEFDQLQSIEQTKNTKRGSCHDQVWLEYSELKRRGYDPKGKFLIEVDSNGRGGATHSFVYFNSEDGMVNWIENAWGGNKGIHGYEDYDHMMADVRSRWERNDEYPELLIGNLDCSKLKAGMDLGDIIDLVELDN